MDNMQKNNSMDRIFRKLRAVILDMDGVLVDTEPIHMEAFRIFMEKQNLKYTQKYLRSFIGYSIEDNITSIIRKYNLKNKLSPKIGIQERDIIYLDLLRRSSLILNEGIPELVEYCLKADIELALASSSSHEQINTILSKISKQHPNSINLFDIFSVITSGDDVLHKKPRSDIYKLTVSKLGKIPSECLAVEDSLAGVKSSVSAGLFTVGLITPYVNMGRLKKAHWLVDSISDIVMQLHLSKSETKTNDQS
jgi:HAD superfamily hydrolase (TIGR01509 family)